MPERRHTQRKKFDFYMRVLDDDTEKTVGHLVDVSPDGFRLETSEPLPLKKEYFLHMELTPDISDKLFMFFAGRTVWCKPDTVMPNMYHVGFLMTSISDHDQEIYQRLLEKYGE